ncbi:tetratricopeptide repeat protein [Undibacterium sp. Rencai35W]|uniref:tetratricopeptide repeat protein n=1 Tax=Undibacterium sp. Rencai35W TaxID=3413046 RepID=UPI003BF0EF5C
MNKYILCFSLLLTNVAIADELADANRLLDNRSYTEAFKLYTRLANSGNAEAQFHLGEMHWYGEGTSVDMSKASEWLQKSANSGNAKAMVALEVIRQRQIRHSDIEYWLSKYDGKDLISGKFNCGTPEIPVLSKTNSEIKNVNQLINTWQNCYNNFVENMNDALPPGKRIPGDISKLMNEQEYEQAKVHLNNVYSKITADSQKAADTTIAKRDAWLLNTEKFVAEKNSEIKAKQALYDILQHQKEIDPQYEVRDRLAPSSAIPRK